MKILGIDPGQQTGIAIIEGGIIRMAREAGSIDSEDVIETMYAAFTKAECAACLREAEVAVALLNDPVAAIRARGEK